MDRTITKEEWALFSEIEEKFKPCLRHDYYGADNKLVISIWRKPDERNSFLDYYPLSNFQFEFNGASYVTEDFKRLLKLLVFV